MTEACLLLSGQKGKVAALAGGTEIIVDLKMGGKRFDHLVALDGIDALGVVEMDGDELRIGSMTTVGAISRNGLVREKFPEVAEVAEVFAAAQVANRATIGGNIAAAVPSADFPPLLIALNAVIETADPQGGRTFALENVFTGPRENALRRGEVITAIRLPRKPAGTGGKYLKFGLRDAGACAVAGVAVVIHLDHDTCTDARLVLGAVAPVPLRVPEAESLMKGRKIDSGTIAEVARIVRAAGAPVNDIRGSKGFRTDIVGVLASRALTTAYERARRG